MISHFKNYMSEDIYKLFFELNQTFFQLHGHEVIKN